MTERPRKLPRKVWLCQEVYAPVLARVDGRDEDGLPTSLTLLKDGVPVEHKDGDEYLVMYVPEVSLGRQE